MSGNKPSESIRSREMLSILSDTVSLTPAETSEIREWPAYRKIDLSKFKSPEKSQISNTIGKIMHYSVLQCCIVYLNKCCVLTALSASN